MRKRAPWKGLRCAWHARLISEATRKEARNRRYGSLASILLSRFCYTFKREAKEIVKEKNAASWSDGGEEEEEVEFKSATRGGKYISY